MTPRAFSPDGKFLAVGISSPTVWDVAAGRKVQFFREPPQRRGRTSGLDIDDSWALQLVFSPDGKLLAAEGTRESTCLWSMTTGNLYRRFPHMEIGHGIAFSKDGKRLISGGRYFRHWDIARCCEIQRLPRHDEVVAVAFGPDGKTLVTADGTTVRLWDAATGRELRQFRGHEAPVQEVAIVPDGTTIAAGGGDGTMILWDAATGREIRRGGDKTEKSSIAFAPDGKTYAASDKRGVRLWDMATGREIRHFPRSDQLVRSLCFAPDGKTLAAAYGPSVWLWNVATGGQTRAFDHVDLVNAMAFSPDGKTLATGDNAGFACVWDTATGNGLGCFGDDPHENREAPSVTSLAFLPDHRLLAVATVEDTGSPFLFQIWDTATGKVCRRIEGHAGHVCALAVAPDGKTLASASADGTTLLWDLTEIGK